MSATKEQLDKFVLEQHTTAMAEFDPKFISRARSFIIEITLENVDETATAGAAGYR